MAENNLRIALFSGTFDPFTIGHADIVKRALGLFDRLIIAVAVNPTKHTLYSVEERVNAIQRLYSGEKRIKVVAYDGMMADLAHEEGARYCVKGVRSVTDFEYEKVQAAYNHRLGDLETVLLYARPELEAVSSSGYRTLVYFHKDASWMLPKKDNDLTQL